MRNIFTPLFLLLFIVSNAQDGVLDPFWGNSGTVTAPITGPSGSVSQTFRQKLIILPNGYMLQTFTVSNGTDNDFGLARWDPDGNLDLSFGGSGTGYVITNLGGDDFTTSMELQSDGKIIVVGYSEVLGDASFALVRYSANGILDGSFGTSGKTISAFGTDNLAYAVEIRPDDKIIVGGTVWNGFVYLLALAQYTANGVLDAGNFNGGNGYVTTSLPGSIAGATSLALKTDGSIVVGGFNSDLVDYDFLLAQYTSAGVLDGTFAGGAGYVITDFAGRDEQAYAVSLTSSGNILLAGYTDNGSGTTAQNDFALAQYTSAGVPDAGFGSGGKLFTDFGLNEIAYSMALQSDGKILLAGSKNSGLPPTTNNDFVIARYTTTGALDPTFGGSSTGKNTINITDNDPGLSMALGNGYIMLGGISGAGAALNNLALARLINTSTPLPITLFSFTGTRQDNSVQLNWKTLEQDVVAYEVERSGDGRNFTKIGRIQSMGNSTSAHNYTFSDAQPLQSVNVYRLKIINTDGSVSYSFVVIVRWNSKASIQAFPNPVITMLNLQLNMPQGIIHVQVADVTGRIVRSLQLKSQGSALSTSIDLGNLQKGIYFVRANNETIKIIKE